MRSIWRYLWPTWLHAYCCEENALDTTIMTKQKLASKSKIFCDLIRNCILHRYFKLSKTKRWSSFSSREYLFFQEWKLFHVEKHSNDIDGKSSIPLLSGGQSRLKSAHKRIIFTMKVEKNKLVNILYLTPIMSLGSLVLGVQRTSTQSKLITTNDLNHRLIHKTAQCHWEQNLLLFLPLYCSESESAHFDWLHHFALSKA